MPAIMRTEAAEAREAEKAISARTAGEAHGGSRAGLRPALDLFARREGGPRPRSAHFQLSSKKTRIDDLAGPARAGRRAEIDDGPVGSLGVWWALLP